jgi:hypothetical protein
VDEGVDAFMDESPTEHKRRAWARKFIDDARKSLYTATICLSLLPSGHASLSQRIKLRQADAESFESALELDPHDAATPYKHRKLLKLQDPITVVEHEARFVARAANNHAMALFGAGNTEEAGKTDEAMKWMSFAMNVLFAQHVVAFTARDIRGKVDKKAEPDEPPKDLPKRLVRVWKQVEDASLSLQDIRADDRERLACRKMLSTSCAWLFLESQRPSDGLRSKLLRVVNGDRAMIVMKADAESKPGDAAEPLGQLRRYLVGEDQVWLHRRGYVRLLVAIHAALEVVPTDSLPKTQELASSVIDTAAELGTRQRRFSDGVESISGDWGTYAYWLSSKKPNVVNPKTQTSGPWFGELGQARRLQALAASRTATRHSGRNELCQADRDLITDLLKHIQSECEMDLRESRSCWLGMCRSLDSQPPHNDTHTHQMTICISSIVSLHDDCV